MATAGADLSNNASSFSKSGFRSSDIMNINSQAYFTLAIEIFLDLPIVTDYFLCEYRVKELLHVSSLVGIDKVIVFIDGLYIDVDEKFLCVHGI